MAAKSKKGSGFERAFCSQLSLWWSGGTSDDLFWRTAGSGGRSTNRKKRGKTADKGCGDICSTDPSSEPFMKVFCLELKRGYNKYTVQDLLDAGPSAATQVWQNWLDQAEASRQSAGATYWMVVAKRDKREPLVAFPEPFHYTLGYVGHSWRGRGKKIVLGRDVQDGGSVLLTTLADFFEHVTPKAISAILEQYGAGKTEG